MAIAGAARSASGAAPAGARAWKAAATPAIASSSANTTRPSAVAWPWCRARTAPNGPAAAPASTAAPSAIAAARSCVRVRSIATSAASPATRQMIAPREKLR